MAVREAWMAEEEPKEVREAWKVGPAPVEPTPPAPPEPEEPSLAQLEYEGLPLDAEARRREVLRRTAMGEVAQAPAAFPLPLPIPGMIGGIGPPAPDVTKEDVEEFAKREWPAFMETLAAVGEVPTYLASGVAGFGAGGLSSAVALALGADIKDALERGEMTAAMVAGEPKTETARRVLEIAVKPIDWIQKGWREHVGPFLLERGIPVIHEGMRPAQIQEEIRAWKAGERKWTPAMVTAVTTPGELATIGMLFKRAHSVSAKIGRGLRPRLPKPTEIGVTAKDLKKMDTQIFRRLLKEERAEKAVKAEEAAKVKEVPPRPKVREVELAEEPVTIEQALAERPVPKAKPETKPTEVALAKEKETPVKDSREGIAVEEVPPAEPTVSLERLNERPELYKEILDNRKLHTKEVITRAEEIGEHVIAEIKLESDVVSAYKRKESITTISKRHRMPEEEVVSILDEVEALGKVKPLTLEMVKDRYRRELREVANEVATKGLSPEQARPLVMTRHERLADRFSDRTRYEPVTDAEGMEVSAFLSEMLERVEPRKRTAVDVDASEAQAREVARAADEVRGVPEVTLEFGGFEGFGKMYRDFANSLKRRSVETEKPLSPEATEVLNRGEIVKHRTFKGRRRPPVFRAELEVLKGLKKLDQVLTHRAFENPIRTFEEAGGETLLDMTIHPWRAREFAISLMKKKAGRSLRELRKKVGSRSRRRIMVYAVSKQKRGMQLLKFRGITEIPKLTPKEMEVYNALRERYKSWYVRLNRVRKAIGKEPFPEEKDYFTFIRTLSLMEGTGFKPMHVRAATFSSQYVKAGATAFRFAKRRVGGKYKLKLDPFEVLEIYEGQAIRHIQLSPLIAKLRELQTVIKDPETGGSFRIGQDNPVFAATLHSWTNHIAGLKPTGFTLPPVFEKLMLRINSNLTAAILGANLRSAMIQVSALRNTVAEVGFGYTLRGIASLIDPRARNMAMRKSKGLITRRYDVTVEDALRSIRSGRLGELQRVGTAVALKPLQILDIETAKACWHGAYKYGLDELGYKPKRAAVYADDIVTKTQASALPGDVAPIQRAVAGRFLTLFQTFTINDWNFLIRDVLGMRNATVDTPMAFAKAMRYVAATTLFNILFEDVLHIQSPFPTPIRAFRESLERGDDTSSLAWNVGKEFIEPIPIIGAARYGKGPGGPGVELLNETVKYITRKPMAEPAWKLGGEWLGLPGTAQVAKTVRAKKRGETPYGQAVGTYTPPEERAKPRRRGRGLRTERRGMRGGI